jgi:hypothetical protein
MQRKKWTAKEVVTESYIKFKEKRKWQLALRRYILEKNPSQFYAPFFGLGIEDFRKWVEVQFSEDQNWENFAVAWQFDHIVPIGYFDFNKEDDLKLCWNFINIRVESNDLSKNQENKIDILAAKNYFETLFAHTGYDICNKMVNKIESIQQSSHITVPAIEHFILSNKEKLDEMASFEGTDFYNLNKGTSYNDILMEKSIFKKFS